MDWLKIWSRVMVDGIFAFKYDTVSRSDFWKAWLVQFLLYTLSSFPFFLFKSHMIEVNQIISYFVLFTIVISNMMVLSAGIRRIRDTGKSGWWILIVFIPIIGTIWILYLLTRKTEFVPPLHVV